MNKLLFSIVFALTISLGYAVPAYAINLTPITTPFNSPIGIDHYEPTNEVVISVFFNAGGNPYNFETVASDGTHSQFSAASGFANEVKIATVRSGNTGGFTTGDLFTGNGIDGQVARITNNGATIISPWADLPGNGNGLMRGSLYVDRTGVFNDELIVVTTAGEVWQIDSSGTGTFLVDVNTHLEGVITVPNNVGLYGPLAGKIIAGAENTGGLMYVIAPDGTFQTFDLDIDIEDIDLIPANENFFGVNFGTGNLLGATASDFAPFAGDILLTDEFFTDGVGLYRLFWDGFNLQTQVLTLDPGSFLPGQWEHVTFSTAGIVEIPPIEDDVVAGEILPINPVALLVAGAQTNLAWMLGVLVSGIGISLVILRRK